MIGIIGGTGFYSLLENVIKKEVSTPYGKPSSLLAIGEIAKSKIVFIPRHGENHELPPHRIPYKANIWAMHKEGVTRIIAPAAVGSLKREIKPGDFIIPDQFINLTYGRDDTFYHGPADGHVTHISSADPYCPVLRDIIINECKKFVHVKEKGTVVVVQGPRFSTKAESDFYKSHDWDVINMTQYPECILARELEICYAAIGIVTDYDTGLKEDPTIKQVTIEEVLRVLKENNEKLKDLIKRIVPLIPEKRDCICAKALEGAQVLKQ